MISIRIIIIIVMITRHRYQWIIMCNFYEKISHMQTFARAWFAPAHAQTVCIVHTQSTHTHIYNAMCGWSCSVVTPFVDYVRNFRWLSFIHVSNYFELAAYTSAKTLVIVVLHNLSWFSTSPVYECHTQQLIRFTEKNEREWIKWAGVVGDEWERWGQNEMNVWKRKLQFYLYWSNSSASICPKN